MAAGLTTTRRGSAIGSGSTGVEKASPRRAKRLSKVRSVSDFKARLQQNGAAG